MLKKQMNGNNDITSINLLSKIEYTAIKYAEYTQFFKKQDIRDKYTAILSEVDQKISQELDVEIQAGNYKTILRKLQNIDSSKSIKEFVPMIYDRLQKIDIYLEGYYYSQEAKKTDISENTELLYIYDQFNKILRESWIKKYITEEQYNKHLIKDNKPLSTQEIKEKNQVIINFNFMSSEAHQKKFLLPYNKQMLYENISNNLGIVRNNYDKLYRQYALRHTLASIIKFIILISLVSITWIGFFTGIPMALAFSIISLVSNIFSCIEIINTIILLQDQKEYKQAIKNPYGSSGNIMQSEFSNVHSEYSAKINRKTLYMELLLRVISLINSVLLIISLALGIQEFLLCTALIIPIVIMVIKVVGNTIAYTGMNSEAQETDFVYTDSLKKHFFSNIEEAVTNFVKSMTVISGPIFSVVVNTLSLFRHVITINLSVKLVKRFYNKEKNDNNVLQETMSETLLRNSEVILPKSFIETYFGNILSTEVQNWINDLTNKYTIDNVKTVTTQEIDKYIEEFINKIQEKTLLDLNVEEKKIFSQILKEHLKVQSHISIKDQQESVISSQVQEVEIDNLDVDHAQEHDNGVPGVSL
ncbi:MAG: hypothetical protein P857_578 [Candidatus Xenolissoclinum pacificiensis L6]|uniref:Uncharacterized protein n=1 Tax=Candidatus Xenolissoclinum pacificiensis L6 TaxID=1401685 RepID=W2V0B4_9RICK|nr:MAG: hypothetical protein P857_578 [Candidatus Xenolissoclinum pacificiensis L6]